jgi:hypothetical protein
MQRQLVRLWRLLLPCLLVFLSGNVHASNGETELKRINAIKAAFVLNIARFVTWPSGVFASDTAPLRLCVYRDNSYGQALKMIEGQRVGHHSLQFSTIENLRPNLNCEILLIPHTALGKFHEELDGELHQPLLTIVDQTEIKRKEHSRDGVIVTLVRQGSRIGFEIDPWKARKANLHMSSELLKLAKIVGEEQ